jgi:hypothetical protein
MGMAIELARFTVKEGAEDRLIAGRAEMVKALHRRFPGRLAAASKPLMTSLTARRCLADKRRVLHPPSGCDLLNRDPLVIYGRSR